MQPEEHRRHRVPAAAGAVKLQLRRVFAVRNPALAHIVAFVIAKAVYGGIDFRVTNAALLRQDERDAGGDRTRVHRAVAPGRAVGTVVPVLSKIMTHHAVHVLRFRERTDNSSIPFVTLVSPVSRKYSVRNMLLYAQVQEL